MKMKRLLSALLCAVILMTSVTVLADTNEATPGEATRCDHTNGAVKTEERNVTYAKDAQTHTKSYDLVTVHTCPDCEKGNYEEEPVSKTDAPEAHTFVESVCSVCGYEMIPEPTATPTATPTAEPTATPCAHNYVDGTCSICGAVCTHNYANGVCTICGKTECGHTGLTTTELKRNRRITGHDERDHYLVYDLYKADYCGICEKIVGEPRLEQADCEGREQHYYVDGETACGQCGYVSSCTHADTIEEVYRAAVEVLSKDEKNHTVKTDIYKQVVCQDCGKILSVEKLEEGIVITEPHGDMLWGGECFVCNYKTEGTCQHSETEEHVYYEWGSVISSDENGHKVKGTKVTEKICKACGDLIDSVRGQQEDIEGPHEFYLGRCEVCNYKNPCAHEKTHVQTSYMMTYDFEITPEKHTFKGCKMEEVWCDVCDSMISEKVLEANGTFTDQHYFDKNGVCVFCDYKRTETPAPTAKPSNDSDNTFVPTPRPNRVNTTPEPTVEPTAAPTAAPMVDTLLSAIAEAETEGTEVTIEVVGAQEIMTETEYTALKTLPAQEQILVTLASIGFEDVVEAATKAMNVELSEDAQALVTQVTERMAAVPEEERAAVEEKLAQYFPVEEIEIDGVVTSYFVIDLKIEVDGVVRVERYGFRLDENGEWIFEKLDLQSVEW